MRMTEQELEAYIRQYTELEKECMKSRFPEKFSNEEFWNQRSREKDGGLPPDSVVQSVDEILKDSRNAVEKFHNPAPFSMNMVALAPCSPFSAGKELYRQSALLARDLRVRLHTHLCETLDEENYVLENTESVLFPTWKGLAGQAATYGMHMASILMMKSLKSLRKQKQEWLTAPFPT